MQKSCLSVRSILVILFVIVLSSQLIGCSNTAVPPTLDESPTEAEATPIDWTMYGHVITPDGTVHSTVVFSVSGSYTRKIKDYDTLKLKICFPDTFRYQLDQPGDPFKEFISQSHKVWGLAYFTNAGFAYDSLTHGGIPICYALDPEFEYAIFDLDDGSDMYLVASTDPDIKPTKILLYFTLFRNEYAFSD